jgi:hypothetical protein
MQELSAPRFHCPFMTLNMSRAIACRVEERRVAPDARQLWETLERALSYHRTRGRDVTSIDALNRILAKARSSLDEPSEGLPRLSPETCTIRLQRWTTSKLDAIRRGKHQRDRPRCANLPVIVVEYEGREYLIDGQTRINRWTADGNDGPHEVIVLTHIPRSS